MGEVRLAAIGEVALDEAAHTEVVGDSASGAVVTFTGGVRDSDAGRDVTALDYSAHPSATAVIGAIAAELAAREGVIAVAVTHRVGSLVVGDVAIVAAVSAAHRQTAFQACAYLVDEVKHRLPIWKRQRFADGTTEWVNSA